MKTFHRNLLPALLMAATLLAGCSSSGNYYLAPDYQENKVNEEVLILPVKQEIFARYFQHTFGFLSSTQEEIFWDALERGYSRSAGVTARTYNLRKHRFLRLQDHLPRNRGRHDGGHHAQRHPAVPGGGPQPRFRAAAGPVQL
ncbi:MAG: hypothetical protein U5K31_05340 [Balneolaceae bacterium]|nr:hypothetical protein [Balneolaceae bacterium]